MNDTSLFSRVLNSSLESPLPAFILLTSVIAGLIALQFTPREEEPQIVVPMVDVLIHAPGLSALQVERLVITPVEKLLAQIPGIEHIYSTSQSGTGVVTLRFYVGENREDSLLNTYNKLYSNQDKVPEVVSDWLVRPVEVDDIPILLLAIWSENPDRYSDYELRRMAEELSTHLQAIPQTSEVNIVGGRSRHIQLLLDPESLAARLTTPLDIVNALKLSNNLTDVGSMTFNNNTILLEAGDALRTVEELPDLVVNVIDNIPIYLRDVVQIVDGPRPPEYYTWIDFNQGHASFERGPPNRPMVVLSVAKQRGTNAVWVSQDVQNRLSQLQEELLPREIHIEILRDYGDTANDKVNNLAASLAFAILTVVVFVGIFLGWRSALVVGLAIPICYGATLALDLAAGYTINRVTLFALILSLGLLVDDPITGLDNIERFLRSDSGEKKQRIIAAMIEIRVPLLMSTLTIILAFIPLAFITGMMGPYMAPMAFNVPISVIMSTAVAFLVTPWLANNFLKPATIAVDPDAAPTRSSYSKVLAPLLSDHKRAKQILLFMLLLFVVTASLPLFRMVPLKLLPFDNKSEIQVLVDMVEGSSLEDTAAMANRITERIKQFPEVKAIGTFVGIPSPIDFNGMVRRYYQREAPHFADLRLTLIPKENRKHQSHAIVLRLRQHLDDLNSDKVLIRVVEVPPGPPVMSTLVAEIYGNTLTPYSKQQEAARSVMARLAREPLVVEIDSTVQHDQSLLRFVTDKQKAALSGIATQDIGQTLAIANVGYTTGYLNLEHEATPLPIELRLAESQRANISDIEKLQVRGRAGITRKESDAGLDIAPQPMVAIGELGKFEELLSEQPLHRKDLRSVVYVTADISGRTPAEVIADVNADMNADKDPATAWQNRNFLSPGAGDGWSIPSGTEVVWGGEGEWRITVRVFRDMGLAFAFALAAIFFLLRIQTASTSLSLIIMSSIPLTVIGIMPGFWLLNQFGEREIAGAPDPVLFTATAMIGMIALAGIVVRNSLILVEFIGQLRQQGIRLKDALLQAGAIRMRPVLLTAGTTLLGNLVIILDPVFSGLALAIIFGIISSTVFTLVVVPIVYYLVFDQPEGTDFDLPRLNEEVTT
jgi:multidrug efflux pump subunit AcrB